MNDMKKLMVFLIISMVIGIASSAYAAFGDVSSEASYKEELERVAALGIIKGTSTGMFEPDNNLTREQFAKVIVMSSGLDDMANSLKGSTVFPDVNSNGWSSGYINEALNKGFIAGMPDGKFHPGESITFAQVCTILVRALGYSDQDVPGIWPRNYIEKAISIGLTEGINIENNSGMPRWAIAVMLDKLYTTNVKKGTPTEADKTFADYTGLYTECIILGNSKTSDKLTSNQVQTDKGIYYVDKGIELEIGNEYRLKINENDTVTTAYYKMKTLSSIAVGSVDGTKVTYTKDSKQESMTLPQKTVYYYQGIKQNYDSLKNVLQSNSSIVFANNSANTGFEYALIFDPQDSNLGQYMECIVLGDSKTQEKLTDNQVMTDKGIFYLSDTNTKLELGNKYGLVIKNDNIVKVNSKLKIVTNMTVRNSFDNTVVYNDSGAANSFVLPDKTAYYYNGIKQSYDNVKSLLKLNTSIILASNDNGVGYEYAIVQDPFYSKPKIAYNYNGEINFTGKTIIKNGFLVNQSDIKEKDVVYEVTDIWGKNSYVLVVDNKILGIVDSISPNVLTPNTIKLVGNNTVYQFSVNMDLNKVKFFKANDVVNISLGYDGKVIDINSL